MYMSFIPQEEQEDFFKAAAWLLEEAKQNRIGMSLQNRLKTLKATFKIIQKMEKEVVTRNKEEFEEVIDNWREEIENVTKLRLKEIRTDIEKERGNGEPEGEPEGETKGETKGEPEGEQSVLDQLAAAAEADIDLYHRRLGATASRLPPTSSMSHPIENYFWMKSRGSKKGGKRKTRRRKRTRKKTRRKRRKSIRKKRRRKTRRKTRKRKTNKKRRRKHKKSTINIYLKKMDVY